DGDHPRLLGEHPCERDLSRCRLLARADRGEQIDQRLVGLARLGREAWKGGSEVVAAEVGVFSDRACEEALAERAERHKADAEFLERRQDVALVLTRPQRVLTLYGRNGLHGMRAADRRRAGF